jgi:hypothetical protein
VCGFLIILSLLLNVGIGNIACWNEAGDITHDWVGQSHAVCNNFSLVVLDCIAVHVCETDHLLVLCCRLSWFTRQESSPMLATTRVLVAPSLSRICQLPNLRL